MKEVLDKKWVEIQMRMDEMIPDHMHDAIQRWLWDGIEPGSFLEAILVNDFKSACMRADDNNGRALVQYGQFFTLYMPSGCWGSPERFKEWQAAGGWNGLLKKEMAQ